MKPTPVPLVAQNAGPRYPLVRVGAQADREAMLRDLWAALELHGVPCPSIEAIVEGSVGIDGDELVAYLGEWVSIR